MKEKETMTDNEIRRILKGAASEAPENPWFTRKVMNRLPDRRPTHRWILWTIYIAVMAVCLAGWAMFVTETDFSVLASQTMKSGKLPEQAVYGLALIAVSTVAIWQMAAAQLHSDHP